MISRRRWMVLSAAAAAGATFFDAPRVLRAAGLLRDDDPYRGWPMGVQSYSLRNFEMLDAVRHIEGMGLHFVELYQKHFPVEASDQELAERKKILADAQLAIAGHGVHPFTKDHDANRQLFEFARRAGIRTLTANPEPDSFDSLEKLVAEYNVRIAIHNHGPGALYDSIDSVVKAVHGRHPLIGACVDTGHFIRSKEDPVKAVRALKGRVFALHVKDEEKQEERSRNVIIGTGHLDVTGLFKALQEVKFPADGDLALEYEANPDNPIDDMKQCLEVARRVLAEVGPRA